jgi:ABC-type transporter Mla maintaining outer membrane lipid asymmetry ATPase subunit MlaF
MSDQTSEAIIRVRDISVQFGATMILDGLNLDVKRGEILGFVGPSGAGKSVLTRTIIGLVPKTSGRIEVFGVDLDGAVGASCFSRARYFPPLPCARISSSRFVNIWTSRSGCSTR